MQTSSRSLPALALGTLVSLSASAVPSSVSVDDSPHRGYYAAPEGRRTGDGSRARPWDLATALAGGNGRVRPGDTIWLRAGTYRGPFRSTVAGKATAPVVVRQLPGERAIVDGAGTTKTTLSVRGPYSYFWGFELTNSDPLRPTKAGRRPNVIANYASHTKYLNLIVHDGGVGFYTEPEFVDVEIAGCIFYNNGWQGPPPDRGHGHALYLKSHVGPLVARDNVMFNQFGYGVHAYTNARTGKLVNIRIEGNVAFNNGSLARGGGSANVLLGGDDYATGDVVRDNLTYLSPGMSVANVQIGYRALKNGHVQLEGNYFVGGTPVLDVGFWTTTTVRGNTFIGRGGGPLVELRGSMEGGGHAWHGNVHRPHGDGEAWTYRRVNAAFRTWRTVTGLGSGDRVEPGMPTATRVVVRPNPYETGRAMVVVYNWGRRAELDVDLGGILGVNDTYEVRNVQQLFGPPLSSGRFTGAHVRIPMTGVTPPIPVGLSRSPAPRTGPDFDVFIVTTR
jgi:hypothetical protein